MGAPTYPSPRTSINAGLTAAERKAVKAEIERLIAALDALDGDCDLEEDDPAGGNVEDVCQVEDWRPDGFRLPPPLYGDDQSKGPTNERQVRRFWERHLMAS